jgi:hypothetical protein
MDDASLSTISFEQRTAHPWILRMALRQYRHTILYWPVMAAIHYPDRIPLRACQCHIVCHNSERGNHQSRTASVHVFLAMSAAM